MPTIVDGNGRLTPSTILSHALDATLAGVGVWRGAASNRRSKAMSMDPIARLFPEVCAGGFTRLDGTVSFYNRVNALLRDDGESVVLDLGAGRGAFLEDPVSYRRGLRLLKGRAARVVGVDIDGAVLKNDALDEAYVVRPDEQFPVQPNSFDLVVSDYTFEHVTDPSWFASEIDRVLRHGGWLCARTPNKWGTIGVTTRLIPFAAHGPVLGVLQPDRRSEDVFPTAYLLNTPKALKKHFPESKYRHIVFAIDSEPAYFGRSLAAAYLFSNVSKVTPKPLRSVLLIFLRKL